MQDEFEKFVDYWLPGLRKFEWHCRVLANKRRRELEHERKLQERRRPRMSLFKVKKSPYWQCSITFEGERIQKSTKFTNKQAALRYEANLLQKLANKRAGIPEPAEPLPFFALFAGQYLETVKQALAKNTVRNYHISLRILSAFHKKRLDQITVADIERFKKERLEAGRSGATINRDMALLRLVLQSAVRQDLLATSPFIARKVKFLREHKREHIVSFSEERRYLAGADPVLADVAVLMLELAMCPGEIFHIRREDVNLRGGSLHIPTGKTDFRKRDVPITERARAVLQARLEAAQGPYLFPKRVGSGFDWSKPMTSIKDMHRRALTASGVRPFRPYDLRHTGATRAAEGGASPLEIQKLLGHASLSTSARYIHLSKKHLASVQQKIERHRIEAEIAEAGEATVQ
jgi:integrase